MKHGIIRKLVMAGFVIVGLVVIGLLVLKQMAQAPPGYYAEIIKAEKSIDEKSRHEQAEVLVGDVVQVRNDIANDPEWTFRLTDKSINAWLAEHPLNDLLADLPEEVRDPRIRFETERLKLAFRWQGKPLESVVSVALKPEFISTNELQITIQNVQAGLLPVSWTRFQNEISWSQFVALLNGATSNAPQNRYGSKWNVPSEWYLTQAGYGTENFNRSYFNFKSAMDATFSGVEVIGLNK